MVERFGAAGVAKEKIAFARDTYRFNFAGTASAFVDEFRNYDGRIMNAFDAAEKSGRGADLLKELESLFVAQNTSATHAQMSIAATVVRVTVSV